MEPVAKPAGKTSGISLTPFIAAVLVLTGLILNEWFLQWLLGSTRRFNSNERMFIWFLQLVFLGCGILLLIYRPAIRFRELLFLGVIFFITGIVSEFLVQAALAARAASERRRDIAKYVGWKPGRLSGVHELPGYGKVHYSTQKHGFRRFGDPDTTKTKLLVIGDSFTQADQVSDGETYYDNIESSGIEVFAHGCGGYGTLQELMTLNLHFDEISPDLILWQFCSNDLINNSYELECSMPLQNNHNVRPYFRDGKVTWQYPDQHTGLLHFLVRYSAIARFFDLRFTVLQRGNLLPKESEFLQPDNPDFQEAIKQTDLLLKLLRKRCAGRRIAAFCVDSQKWLGTIYQELCESNQILYIPDVPDVIEKAKQEGLVVDGTSVNDSHWNSRGHALVGKRIAEFLREKGLETYKYNGENSPSLSLGQH